MEAAGAAGVELVLAPSPSPLSARSSRMSMRPKRARVVSASRASSSSRERSRTASGSRPRVSRVSALSPTKGETIPRLRPMRGCQTVPPRPLTANPTLANPGGRTQRARATSAARPAVSATAARGVARPAARPGSAAIRPESGALAGSGSGPISPSSESDRSHEASLVMLRDRSASRRRAVLAALTKRSSQSLGWKAPPPGATTSVIVSSSSAVRRLIPRGAPWIRPASQ